MIAKCVSNSAVDSNHRQQKIRAPSNCEGARIQSCQMPNTAAITFYDSNHASHPDHITANCALLDFCKISRFGWSNTMEGSMNAAVLGGLVEQWVWRCQMIVTQHQLRQPIDLQAEVDKLVGQAELAGAASCRRAARRSSPRSRAGSTCGPISRSCRSRWRPASSPIRCSMPPAAPRRCTRWRTPSAMRRGGSGRLRGHGRSLEACVERFAC